ncbi:MAG: hypothetical protein R2684_05680 [Pyrinomonadaceae bacterium]
MAVDEKGNSAFRAYREKYLEAVERSISDNLPGLPDATGSDFNKLARSAVLNAEDRFHPFLVLMGAELVGGSPELTLPAATAVEYVTRAFALLNEWKTTRPIFDRSEDREAEDFEDKDLGVRVAIALLNGAYPLVLTNHSDFPGRSLAAHSELVECIGAFLPMFGEDSISRGFGEERFEFGTSSNKSIFKTSAPVPLGLRLGALLSGADYIEIASITRFGEYLGDALRMRRGSSSFAADGNKKIGASSDPSVLEGVADTSLLVSGSIENAKLVLAEEFADSIAKNALSDLCDILSSSD